MNLWQWEGFCGWILFPSTPCLDPQFRCSLLSVLDCSCRLQQTNHFEQVSSPLDSPGASLWLHCVFHWLVAAMLPLACGCSVFHWLVAALFHWLVGALCVPLACCCTVCSIGPWLQCVPLAYGCTLFHWPVATLCVPLACGCSVFQWLVAAVCSIGLWLQCVPLACGCTVFHWPVAALCFTGLWLHCVFHWPVAALCSTGLWLHCVPQAAAAVPWLLTLLLLPSYCSLFHWLHVIAGMVKAHW